MNETPFSSSDLPASAEPSSQSYSVEGPPTLSFDPWHHPRKQFVRSEQWATIIEDHLEKYPIEGRPLSYIGLPGDDLLDIRYFADRICSHRHLPLRYLGLNANIDSTSARRTRIDSAMFDIRTQYSFVSEASEVVFDPLASIAKAKSIISTKMEAFGFFDIVNLDLCDGLAKNPPGAAQASNYEAIQFLLGTQLKSRSSWLLFLTTRVGEDHCEQTAKKILHALVSRNESNCPGFAQAILTLCGSSLPSASPEQQLLVVNLAGLMKWLGGMCISESGWNMETVAVDSYTIWSGSPIEDLFSVAIRFVPISSPARDPVGLGAAQPQKDDECRIALEIMDRLIHRRNVDEVFRDDKGLYERIVADKANLLKSAGFDLRLYVAQLVGPWKLPDPHLV